MTDKSKRRKVMKKAPKIIEKEDLLRVLQERHACKLFDENKKVSKEDLEFILEAGRLSPSSYGMEHWKFLVITNKELKEKIRKIAYDQAQVSSCSHLIVILAKIKALKDQKYIRYMFERRNMPKDLTEFYIERYTNFVNSLSKEDLSCWSKKQTFIAATSMMIAASSIGIDSCPMEGFDKKALEELLNINTEEYEASLMLPIGYRVNEPWPKYRLPLEEITEYID